MIREFQKLLKPLASRVANLVSRAVVERVNDAPKLQEVQLSVLAEETREGVEHFQRYGFTSVPLSGAEAVVLFVGGRRDHGLVVAVDDRRHRPTGLQPGEVAVYSETGASVVLKADGSVEVNPAAGAVVKLAGSVESAVLGSTYRAQEAVMNGVLSTQLAAAGMALNAAGVDPTLVGLAPAAATSLVTAGTALSAAAVAPSTFEAGAATYLSQKVKLS